MIYERVALVLMVLSIIPAMWIGDRLADVIRAVRDWGRNAPPEDRYEGF